MSGYNVHAANSIKQGLERVAKAIEYAAYVKAAAEARGTPHEIQLPSQFRSNDANAPRR